MLFSGHHSLRHVGSAFLVPRGIARSSLIPVKLKTMLFGTVPVSYEQLGTLPVGFETPRGC